MGKIRDMAKTISTAERIERAARKLGYTVDGRHYAETGSIYLNLYHSGKGIGITVRIADHGELYLPKQPERRLDVSPEGITIAEAIERLGHPEDIEPVQAAPLNDLQREWIREQKERAEKFKATWKALRAEMPAETFEEFRRLGGNRPAARKIARRNGWSVAATYSALTNGKKWSR